MSKSAKYVEVELWHPGRKYKFMINHDSKLWYLESGAVKTKQVQSFKIPGATETCKVFECPKCFLEHRVPDAHGALLMCVCQATWSFWGVGIPIPEGETADEIATILNYQGVRVLNNYQPETNVQVLEWTKYLPVFPGRYLVHKKGDGVSLVEVVKCGRSKLKVCHNGNFFDLTDFSHWIGPVPLIDNDR